VDETEYSRTPDSRVELTENGWEQARQAGEQLRAMLLPDGRASRVFVYCSPYIRCQQTLEGVLKGANIPRDSLAGDVEEPRLREQDFGNFQDPAQMQVCKTERLRFGTFYYRFPQGESGADVYDRVSNWMGGCDMNSFPSIPWPRPSPFRLHAPKASSLTLSRAHPFHREPFSPHAEWRH
jgi:broad specificity phosphatase PhoE